MHQQQAEHRPLRVVLLVESAVLGKGLHYALEAETDITVVAELPSVAEAVKLIPALQPHVALVELPLLHRIDAVACRSLFSLSPQVALLILSPFDWNIYLAEAWAVGAAGFLMNQVTWDELVGALRQASQGNRLFTSAQQRRLWEWEQETGRLLRTLTPREWDVFHWVTEGKGNREIAALIGVTEKTVNKHVGALLTKLEVKSRAELAAFARHHHLDGGKIAHIKMGNSTDDRT